jgi:zinc protease
MKIKAFLVMVALVAAFPSLASGVTENVLPNGLKVLVVEDHKSPLAVFQIWYRVGSRNEVSGRTGISHVLEHMMFKATGKYGSKEFSKTVRRYGGFDNATTSKDYTVYYQVLPSDRIELSFMFESDRMHNLLLEGDETRPEVKVVMEERRLRSEDDPQQALFENAIASAFKVHPYHWPVIGWMSDLESIGPEDLHDYYRKYYSPDNAFIVVAGDVDPKEMLRLAETYFSDIVAGPPRDSHVSAEPPQEGQRRVYLKKEAELPSVVAAYHVPSLPEEDGYALEVLAAVLSEGRSSRLYRSLVYHGKLALDAYAEYGGLHVDPFLFFLGATAAPGKDIGKVEEALYEEVRAMGEKPPDEFELQKAKNQLEASFVMGQDSIRFQAQVVGLFEMLGDWRLKDRYVEGIRKVTAQDLQRVARKYLREENRTVGVLIPEGRGE